MNFYKILDVNFAVTNYADLNARVQQSLFDKDQIRLNFCNVHVTMMAQENPALKVALNNQAALTVTDGMPLVWALKSWHQDIKTRVYGPDFFDLCISTNQTKTKHFFYGSTEKTLAKLKKNLLAKYPNLEIAGMFSPPFRALSATEELETAEMINKSQADIIWVGLGAPKQELWIDKMAKQLDAPVLAAVGAAFDFHAGTVDQAPSWMQKNGLEWLYRFYKEPKRLWYRYCFYNPWFILAFTKERIFKK